MLDLKVLKRGHVTQPLRIFISSPGDVRAAREIAAHTIERLAQDYARFFHIQPYLWESEAVIASGHFQDSLELPSAFDVVVVILWSRLGTLLPERTSVREYKGIDGRSPVTGTEWEFEEALQGWRSNQRPDLLVYRCMRPASFDLADGERRAHQLQQLSSLDKFWGRHFRLEGELGYRMFTTDAEFAIALESNLRKRIDRRLSIVTPADRDHVGKAWVQAPFRGLESYEFEHAPIYFGQDEPLAKAMLQLTSNAAGGNPFLLVLGASGSGKSSLVKAGILPKLFVQRRVAGAAFVRRVIFWPSDARDAEDLFEAFARRLVTRISDVEGLPELIGPGQTTGDLAAHFRNAAAQPTYPIGTVLGQLAIQARHDGRMLDHESPRLILVIDQLEELFTNERLTKEERRQFVQLLSGLLRSGIVWIIATMRKDFWHRADDTPDLVNLAEGSGRLELLPPGPPQLSQMIRRPAEAAGIHFESDPTTSVSLSEMIAEEVAREPGALPLLSYLLDQLYRADVLESASSTLTYATYEKLGRLEGAIATKAELVMAKCAPQERQALGSVLFALVQLGVTEGEVERAVARRVALSAFPVGTPRRRLVEALLNPDARLLVSDAEVGNSPTVRVAHEALISRWGLARDYVQSNVTSLKVRRRIEERYVLWQALQAADDAVVPEIQTSHPVIALRSRWRKILHAERGLLGDIDASDGKRLLREHRTDVEPHLVAYIERSIAHEERRRTRSVRILAGVSIFVTILAIVATGAGWIAVQKRDEAEYQATQTRNAQSQLLTEIASERLKTGSISSAQSIILEVLSSSAARPSPAAMDVFQQVRAADRQIAILVGHGDRLETAFYSPDGTRIVSASRDKTTRIWDAKTGAQLKVLLGHEDMVMTAAYSPDGTRIVTASADKTARVWDSTTGAQLAVLVGHTGWVRSAAFSSDGRHIITASYDNSARIWDALTGAQQGVLQGHTDIVEWASFSPDSQRVVTASLDGTARVWDVHTQKSLLVLTGHRERVATAAYSPDGTRIVTASFDQTARIWDARSGASLAILTGHTERVESAAYSPDGRFIVTAAGDSTARIWDAATGAQLDVLAGHTEIVLSAAYSPDGSRIVTASYDHTVRIWGAAAIAPAATLVGHRGLIESASFSPDGTRVLTASRDKTARVWDSRSGASLVMLSGHGDILIAAAFSPDGTRILTTSFDKTGRLWDARTGASIALLLGHTDVVRTGEFSRDGARILTTSLDNTARIWDVSGAPVQVIRTNGKTFTSASFSPDRTRFVTTASDNTAQIWDANEGVVRGVLSGHSDIVNSAVYSPDGTRIVTGSNDKTLRIWDARSGVTLSRLTGFTSPIESAVFSPGGKRLLTASDDGIVRVLDVGTGIPLEVLMQHDESENAAEYSPDSTHIVTATNHKTAVIWDAESSVDSASQVLWSKAAEFDPLTQEERTQLGRTPDPSVRVWSAANSECDASAAAFYDPDRLAPGVALSAIPADASVAACILDLANESKPRSIYQLGRALAAKRDFQGARKQLELAVARGYPAALIDLGNLLLDASAGSSDPNRAVSLYQQAWSRGVPIAAASLGHLYELGSGRATLADKAPFAANQTTAWTWYEKGAAAREPIALVRFAERDEEQARDAKTPQARTQSRLHAIETYATAVELARREDWPDEVWKGWRYRRATLARLLGRENLMAQVADVYARAVSNRQAEPATFLGKIQSKLNLR